MLNSLTYELSMLAKAIQHKNLSAASAHVGLSQPQLSRLIAKVEAELNIVLLDRTARRKSGWTPIAHELSLAYTKGMRRLEEEITALAQEREITELHIGTLEGLSPMAVQFTRALFEKLNMKTVHVDVFDFSDLDAQFLNGTLDLIFTARAPSKQKFKYTAEVGYQTMDTVNTDESTAVLSPFEFTGQDKKSLEQQHQHVLVSNSLAIRQNWLKDFGGTGTLPGEAKKVKGKALNPVYVIGSDLLQPALWKKMSEMF